MHWATYQRAGPPATVGPDSDNVPLQYSSRVNFATERCLVDVGVGGVLVCWPGARVTIQRRYCKEFTPLWYWCSAKEQAAHATPSLRLQIRFINSANERASQERHT